VEEKKA